MGGWAIALHGGAGMIAKEKMTAEWRKRVDAALYEILNIGVVALEINLTALEAVELVVRALEDNTFFNAGRGSVLTNKGTVEMEACIMDGRNKDCGAVSGLSTVVHPVSLARLVMEHSPHVYLAFGGAEEFARHQGVETVDTSFFITEENLEKLEKARETNSVQLDFAELSPADANGDADEYSYGHDNGIVNEFANGNGNANGVQPKENGAANGFANGNVMDKNNGNGNGVYKENGYAKMNGNGNVNKNAYKANGVQALKAEFETVGCVAVDSFGNCAAATSTGGLVNKMSGRIGDTPLVGAGTYANHLCGVSGTGRGEEFIKHTVAREVAAMMEYKELPLGKAVHKVVHERLPEGMGGLVAVSATGEVAMAFNTLSMFRASAQQGGDRQIGIW